MESFVSPYAELNDMKTTDRVMSKIALPVIASAGILLILAIVVSAKNTNTETNAYIRVINCIVSHNANDREQSDIEQCYVTVERQMHTQLQRYDNSSK